MRTQGAVGEPNAFVRVVLPLLFGIVAGFVVSILLLGLLSMALAFKDLPHASVVPLSFIAYGGGALTAGFVAARLFKSKGMVLGALSGLLFFLALYITGATMHELGVGTLALIKLVVSILFGCIGGICAVNIRQKRNR